jgi:hypothetical protein
MTTPTGFKFLYNGVSTDFADVFYITNQGNQYTGYKSLAYGLDLGSIFAPIVNGNIQTSYKNLSSIDLGSIFALPNSYSQPIITTPTNVCYKTATISWTNSQTPTDYTLTQTGTSSTTYITTSLSQVVTLINGGTYTFTVTANYSGGTQVISNPLSNYTQPATSTYFIGYKSSSVSGSNTTLTFTSSGTLTNLCSIIVDNASVLIVGGGGGGGGGYTYGTGGTNTSGGGGGGGGEAYSSPITINASTTVIIGSGGVGGAFDNNGASGTLSSAGTLSASPGLGGQKGSSSDSNPAAGGNGGGVVGTTAGGNGGKGNTSGASGQNSDYYNISKLNIFSGGGGGGLGVGSGGGGGNGIGGTGAGTVSSGQLNGSPGVSNGGGGGGSGVIVGSNNGAGGPGKDGIVIFTIPN